MYEALLKATPEYQKIAASFAKPGPAALFGLPPAGRALLYAALQKDLGRVLCIVTPGEAEATHFADDLKALGLSAAVFPPRDFMLRPVEGAGREYEYRRLSVLGSLAGGRLNAVCVPAEALLQYTVPRDEFLKNTLTLKPGMVYNREGLVAQLFAAGYVRRSQVDGPGQFSVRGDIVDIYAPDMRQPARVEYWDDEVDSISSFDLLTQRRDSALEKIYLSPAREVLFGDTAETAEALRSAIKKARGRHRTALEKAMEADLAQLDSGLMPEAMDKYYGLRYPSPATLLDHLDTPLFILDEVGGIRDAQKATEFRRSEELTGLLEEGVLCPGLDVLYQTMDDLAAAAQKQSTLLCENFLRGMNEFKLKDLINAEAFAAPNWNGDLISLREDLDPLIAQGYAVTLFSGTPKGAAALTRDRIFANCEWNGHEFLLVDTGGIEPKATEGILAHMREQAQIAIDTADCIIMVVDVRDGLTAADEDVAHMLRRSHKPIILAVNKCDKVGEAPMELYEFYNLGFDEVMPISSVHGHGTGDLLDAVCAHLDFSETVVEEDRIPVAIIGRPNVGKSSLTNRILGENRMIVANEAGTTRDAIDTPVDNAYGKFIFTDTAGLRKRSNITDGLERYMVVRALAAVERSRVALILVDATVGFTEQDSKVAGYAHDQGKACIIVVNKWDAVEGKETNTMEQQRRGYAEDFSFMGYAPIIFISAQTGYNVNKLMQLIRDVDAQNGARVPTGVLNEMLARATARMQPPSDKGRRLKIFYLTQASTRPPTFVAFVNAKHLFHFSYQRYLINQIRENFGLEHTPIRLVVRERGSGEVGAKDV